jgi:nicotinamidase-related amidase
MAVELFGHQLWTRLAEKLQPKHTAVLVVDMQNDFCHSRGALAARGAAVEPIRAIIPALASLLQTARRVNVTVAYLQMTCTRDGRYNSAADLARRVKVWGQDVPMATIEGEWGHQIIEEIASEPQDLVVRKHRNNAFIGTDLDLLLRARGIRTVIVTGTATQACVLETALAAQGHDYYVVVPRDACACSDQGVHQAALTVLQTVLHEQGVVSASQVIECWTQSEKGKSDDR